MIVSDIYISVVDNLSVILYYLELYQVS